ncbi:RHS repeat-associated core domain-containing protein [uncultured Flavobacterium sp.]|uniref:RHS repeat domain-containing protein n=1 Tax=uncultured Flavobacterium sp. TaxID=165435 RepID=UPI0025E6D334|nr:RHS repeat-associated core domain-containing protein [uncultured Flavobacterium sp.]
MYKSGYRPDLFAFGIGYDTPGVGISGVEGLYNGNISETHWRSGSDNVLRSYGYRYDALNRLTDAFYKRESLATNGYNEHISYDPNGNITMLQRFGGLDEQNISLEIDNLGYRYGAGSNKLLAVGDASGSPEGFSDGTNSGDDFAYDASGNMTSDKNKNITSIAYNHLNLPVRIVFGGDLNTRVDYMYDALGAKLQKTVVQYNPVGDHSIVLTSVTDYLGFQYKDGVLQFFPTSEGYVSHTKGSYSYVYNYTDHLGNVRMSYTKNPANPSELKIIEESHYYPFGLKHQNYNSEEFLFDKKGSNLQLRAPAEGQILPYQYKYNGKEFQDELGLNWYDYEARNYDPATGRWMNIDPMAEISRRYSPYAYALDNPVYFIDPDGMVAEDHKPPKKTLSDQQRLDNGVLKGVQHRLSDYWNFAKKAFSNPSGAGWDALEATARTVAGTVSFLNDPISSFNNSSDAITARASASSDPMDEVGQVIGEMSTDAVALEIVGAGASRLFSVGGKTATISVESTAFNIEAPVTNTLYKRPNNATTVAQRASVQGKTCVDCGGTSKPMVANHITPLVEEHYTTGTINIQKMRSLEAVNSQCTTCSNKQGGKMSQYSKQMKRIINERTKK